MGILELFVLAIGLSMDAFAVSICKGLSVQKLELKHMLIVGAYFGGFQALMPAIGYLLGSQFEHLIVSIDHWIAFVLLLFSGLTLWGITGREDLQWLRGLVKQKEQGGG